jgi:membrane-bound metal-dependent hydrolase YbcI (DUF457 family)
MFVGHYAAALAARTAEPRAPLWAYVLGCQALDIAWGGLVTAGVEKISVDPALPGSALVLSHMPFSHGLPAAIGWSVVVGAGLMTLLRLPRRAGLFLGLAVFSHWILDFLVHRPDLPLLWSGPKVGLGLWNHPVLEEAVEMGLLAMAGAPHQPRPSWPRRQAQAAPAFLGFLLLLQIVPLLSPLGGAPLSIGESALGAYLVTGLIAWMVEPRVVKTA